MVTTKHVTVQDEMSTGVIGVSADRRSDMRFLTVYRLVKVEHAGDEGLACCRNISDGGVKLELHMNLALGDQVTVSFSASNVLAGKVIWANGNDYGIAFNEPVDCMSLLGGSPMPARAATARAPRLTTRLSAKVAYDGGACQGVVSDISIRGLKIATDTDGGFEPGLRVRVILEGGRECDGVVRWTSDNIAGVMLITPLKVEDLGSVRRLSNRDRLPPAEA